eukprot:GHUV01050780.1.p1 GENE.GHUV01050780.1~~GHUV01050780.1.p1  ORF type:complete len:104 (+),score=18.42 GHUV01050780.1:227-538(+)
MFQLHPFVAAAVVETFKAIWTDFATALLASPADRLALQVANSLQPLHVSSPFNLQSLHVKQPLKHTHRLQDNLWKGCNYILLCRETRALVCHHCLCPAFSELT